MGSVSAPTFGELLRQRRKALDLTQDDLAERVGCAPATIRMIELGQRRPSKQMADLLAECLRVPEVERAEFVALARGSEPVQVISPLSRETTREASELPPNNLPAHLTALIGRDDALEEITTLLRGEGLARGLRLLTLTGPPGIGKTRLALQAASCLLHDFDAVVPVMLASVQNAALVMRTIAGAFSLRDKGTEPSSATLNEYLRDKKVLVVLDNFEHVVAAAPVVVELLLSCPRVKMLVTSREALHVRGEHRYEVPSLDSDSSVRLFMERARQVAAEVSLTGELEATIAAICARLDGLPLAIELVAARARMLSPQALLVRLENSDRRLQLGLAATGARDLPDRHKTLRNAIAWSYDLLDEDEQMLFRHIGVFRGSFSFKAIEAILEVAHNYSNYSNYSNYNGQHSLDLFDGVQSLLDKSLLRQREGSDGEARFWMLETIREYAKEKLEETGEARVLEREHALYFMSLAEEAEPQLIRAKALEWLGKLEEEHDNLRAALRWALEGERSGGEQQRERAEIGLRTASALHRFWSVRGYFSEGREWLDRLLESLGPPASERRDGQVEALDTGEQQRLMALTAEATTAAGNLAFEQGDYSIARSLFEESLILRRALGDLRSIAHLLNNLGNLANQQGYLAIARSLYEESLALRREVGDKYGIAGSLNNLGLVALEQGDLSTARLLLEEAVTLYRGMGDKGAIAFSLGNLGLVALEQEDYTAARSLYEESLALRRDIGHKRGIALALAGLGEVIVGVAVAGSDRRRVEKGTTVLGAAGALLESMGIVFDREDRLPYERAVASARSQLGEEPFEWAWQEGESMSMVEAINFALKTDEYA